MNTFLMYSGLAIVFGTHLHMINSSLPASMHQAHAYLNLGAGGLILLALR